ncbi:MAG: hypothetical protein ACOC9W_00320 [Persicimonas sp.]
MTSTQRIAILGAGPIGLEAALFAVEAGFEVDVYERDEPGAHVERWEHVRLFSPWKMNRSSWGEAALREAGFEVADADAFPTGREYLDRYLLPLSRIEPLVGRIHEHSRVVGVARRDALKGDFIGDERRAAGPFVLLVDTDTGERYVEADIVIDTTGVYDQPGHLGPGGLPALGERSAEALIERYIPDVLGAQRPMYAQNTTLLVGSGYSAVTTARLFDTLHAEEPGTRLFWLLLEDKPPLAPIPDDPLSGRLELSEFGSEAATGRVDGIEPVYGQLHRIAHRAEGMGAEGLGVEIALADGSRTLEIDRIIANVGYRPDPSVYRELQVHQCYATEGPMKLSAYLLAQKGDGGGDCLQQTSGGFDTLVSPEPNFYILGSKSYGRNSDFLLKLGFEQIEELFSRV